MPRGHLARESERNLRKQAGERVGFRPGEPTHQLADTLPQEGLGRDEGALAGVRELEPLATAVILARASRQESRVDEAANELRDGGTRDPGPTGELRPTDSLASDGAQGEVLRRRQRRGMSG